MVLVQPLFFALAARATFFLRSQRRRRPWSTPGCARCLALLGWGGGCGTRPCGPQTVLALSRPSLRCSASHKGPERRHGPTSSVLFQTLFRVSSLGVRWFSTSRRQRRATEGFAERARGLSEGRSPEFRSAREDRVAQGTRAAGADAGSPSFCLLFLGEARKSKARRQRETPRSNEYKKTKPCSVPGLHGLSAVWR